MNWLNILQTLLGKAQDSIPALSFSKLLQGRRQSNPCMTPKVSWLLTNEVSSPHSQRLRSREYRVAKNKRNLILMWSPSPYSLLPTLKFLQVGLILEGAASLNQNDPLEGSPS